MSVLRGAQSSLEAFSGSRSKEPDRDLHHVPLRNLPSSYSSKAQHPRTTPLLVPIRSSSIRVLFPVRTNPQFTISIPLPCSYPVPAPLSLPIDQLSVLFRNLPRTQYSSQELPEAQGLVIAPTQLGSPGYSSSSPGTHALLSLLIWELHHSLCG